MFILKRKLIPDHLICLLEIGGMEVKKYTVYGGQEVTVRMRHGTMD